MNFLKNTEDTTLLSRVTTTKIWVLEKAISTPRQEM